MDAPGGETQNLTWENVGLAFSFILFDAVVSKTFGLGVGTSLVTSAVRCVVQLTLVALVLQKVFDANHPWAVAGIACTCCFIMYTGWNNDFYRVTVVLLNFMGTAETGEHRPLYTQPSSQDSLGCQW